MVRRKGCCITLSEVAGARSAEVRAIAACTTCYRARPYGVMSMANTKGMGKTQKKVLELLRENKRWCSTAGWCWGTDSETERFMEQFVQRGLAKKEPGAFGPVYRPSAL